MVEIVDLGPVIKTTYEGEANTNAFTDADKTKLDGIAIGAQVNTVTSVSGKTGAVTLDKSDVGLNDVDNTADLNKPLSTAQGQAIANAISTFAQNLDKEDVGLGNVDNTSDANKPISSATQTALNDKAPLVSPTFTGTVSGITKTMVGLGNVDNTSDANKPVSSATQTALNGKISNITGLVTAGSNVTITGNGTSVSPYNISSSGGGGGGGAVDSVNGQTGVVVLNADNIDDTSTSHRFVSAGDITKLSNLSGTNTGDQTSVTGNAGTATALENSRTIGGVSFDGTANIVPQTIQMVNDAADTTCFILFGNTSGTVSQQPKTNSTLIFNAATGILGATGFSGPLTGNVTGNVSGSSGSTTGNAATATALQTARTINGTSFNGTANITVTAAAGTLTGTTLAASVVTSSLTSVGTITTGTWNATPIASAYIASGLDAAKIGNGSVSNAEFQYLDGVTSSIQTQIDTKVSSNTAGITGADQIINMVSLTSAEYAAITPNAQTYYVITDA